MVSIHIPTPPAHLLHPGDRFAKYGIANSEEARRSYRQMLFEAPGANNYLCAAILDPETLYQRSSSAGTPLFPDRLKQLGIMPGVKPHLKVYALPGQKGSTVMQVGHMSQTQ